MILVQNSMKHFFLPDYVFAFRGDTMKNSENILMWNVNG